MSLLDSFRKWLARRRIGRLVVCLTEPEYKWRLSEIWDPPPLPPTPPASEAETGSFRRDFILFSRKPPPTLDWKIAFTSAFTKAIAQIDRSMQGRVLLAIAELSINPTTARGDTIKPLTGDRRGAWRYRLGDFRLVYEPQSTDRMVVLIDFAARSQAYE
jgi:mRNA interferase RelE/StbE